MKMMKRLSVITAAAAVGFAISCSSPDASAEKKIIHDAEYYILERQHASRWAEDDAAVDKRLAEIRKANGGKPPNILYILIDDIGFGEIGEPYLNYVRGYETPNINAFADEGLRFMRMYTEPSCTPTRVAFMTGRQPYRLGMAHTSVAMDGFGMADKEVTLAEILTQAFMWAMPEQHLGIVLPLQVYRIRIIKVLGIVISQYERQHDTITPLELHPAEHTILEHGAIRVDRWKFTQQFLHRPV
jgi:hypothetical protein